MGLLKNIVVGVKNVITDTEIPVEQERIKICKACAHYTKGTAYWCGKCPCYMKAKVKSPKAHCAIKKW